MMNEPTRLPSWNMHSEKISIVVIDYFQLQNRIRSSTSTSSTRSLLPPLEGIIHIPFPPNVSSFFNQTFERNSYSVASDIPFIPAFEEAFDLMRKRYIRKVARRLLDRLGKRLKQIQKSLSRRDMSYVVEVFGQEQNSLENLLSFSSPNQLCKFLVICGLATEASDMKHGFTFDMKRFRKQFGDIVGVQRPQIDGEKVYVLTINRHQEKSIQEKMRICRKTTFGLEPSSEWNSAVDELEANFGQTKTPENTPFQCQISVESARASQPAGSELTSVVKGAGENEPIPEASKSKAVQKRAREQNKTPRLYKTRPPGSAQRKQASCDQGKQVVSRRLFDDTAGMHNTTAQDMKGQHAPLPPLIAVLSEEYLASHTKKEIEATHLGMVISQALHPISGETYTYLVPKGFHSQSEGVALSWSNPTFALHAEDPHRYHHCHLYPSRYRHRLAQSHSFHAFRTY